MSAFFVTFEDCLFLTLEKRAYFNCRRANVITAVTEVRL